MIHRHQKQKEVKSIKQEEYKSKLLEVMRDNRYLKDAEEIEKLLEPTDCSRCIGIIDGDITKEILGPRIGKCYNHINRVVELSNTGENINDVLDALTNRYDCLVWKSLKEKYTK